jgi:hypothetical protein
VASVTAAIEKKPSAAEFSRRNEVKRPFDFPLHLTEFPGKPLKQAHNARQPSRQIKITSELSHQIGY